MTTTGAAAPDDATTDRLAWWVSPLVVVTAATAVYALRSLATVECHIGINAGVAMLTALLVLPAWCLAVWAVTEVVRRRVPRPVALAVILLLVWAATSLVLGWLGAPEGYPSDSPTCTDNVPHWWPRWLPS